MAEYIQLENEREIVESAKTSDEAFGVLYEFYFPRIYGYIFKRVGNHEVAEDIVSMTFMKVFCGLERYKYKKVSFGAWVYKIATNNLIDHYRKQGRNKEIGIDYADNVRDENPGLLESVERGQNREMVIKVLDKLNHRYKRILNLKYFADLSHEEIARILGVSDNNVRVLVHRALRQFEKVYDDLSSPLEGADDSINIH